MSRIDARLGRMSEHPLYWLAVVAVGLTMEGIALYYQYGLNYGPCILCVHVRAWILGMVLVATAAVFFRKRRIVAMAAHVLLLALAVGLLSTSWETLGIERGWVFGSCELKAEFPTWLPLHGWFPAAFEAWELCGYTPELLFGVTMAEGLVAVATLTILFMALQLLVIWRAG